MDIRDEYDRLQEEDKRKDVLGLDADLPDPALLISIKSDDVTILKEIGSGTSIQIQTQDGPEIPRFPCHASHSQLFSIRIIWINIPG